MLFARVAVPVPLGRAFTYVVPDHMIDSVRPGARVLCDFGRRRVLGIVLDISDHAPDLSSSKLKPVRAVVDRTPVIPEELLGFLRELARYYLAPVGEVMRLAVPAVERSAAQALAQQGLSEASREAVGRLVQVASLSGSEPSEPLRGQARAIFEHLLAVGPTPLAELETKWGNARSAVKRLESLFSIERVELERDAFSVAVPRDSPPELTAPQNRAVEAIVQELEQRTRHAFLLDGVTASGKTEVYLRAVQRCIDLGRSAIVLVPEIALTPQLVARFRARIGDSIAVLHSALSELERHTMWKRLRSGELRVVVGARSALFAPVQDLALVCVDEEHDGSFKQEEGVRYHARDMALLRAHRAHAVCVLGSATPSLSSEALVRAERLERLELPERARKASVLPTVSVIDMRRIGPGPGGERLLSLPLFRALEHVLSSNEQSILFLNRRGFSPSLVCEGCGKISECPNCSVALTLHRSLGERLRCHYCEYSVSVPKNCKSCGSDRISEEGAGTERIEHVLANVFPGARVARLDRDVASGTKSERVLSRMRRGEIDILVGTQMVTKGHDLPNVTLVGVLNADAALSMPDFRASEKTFQLLVQVAGRAGRAEIPGAVLIQTRQPEHPAIVFAARHDVAGFIQREMLDREELRYPPYTRIALVRVEALEEERAVAEAGRLARLARRSAPREVDILGPAPAPLARLRNRYRYRFLVRSKQHAPLHETLLSLARASTDRRVRVVIDVDPVSML